MRLPEAKKPYTSDVTFYKRELSDSVVGSNVAIPVMLQVTAVSHSWALFCLPCVAKL